MKQLYASVLAVGILAVSSVHGQAPTYEWTKTFYCNDPNQLVCEGGGSSIATDALGNVYTTGWFSDTVDFDPGPGMMMQYSPGTWSMFLLKLDAQGNLVWVRVVAGTPPSTYAKGSTLGLDAAGNIYTTGNFKGTVDFDPGAGVSNLTSTGPRDIYVMKFDPQGNFVWAGGVLGGYCESPEIGVSTQGNVHLTGYYCGTYDVDPGAGVTALSNPNGTISDFFIIKLDASGNFLWAHSLGNTGAEYSTSIHVDAQDNVFTTGAYNGTVDFDPGANTYNLTAVGSDVFILKLDPQGNFAWAKTLTGNGGDISATILPDASGNVYVSGVFGSTCDFDPSAATYNMTSFDSNGDQFVLKLTSEGSFLWAVQLTLTGCGENFNMALDPAGDPYLAGNFKDSADLDPGPAPYVLYGTFPLNANMFVMKMNSSGIFQWAVAAGGNDHVYADALSIGNDFSVFTYGTYSGTADFDPDVVAADYITAGTPLTLFVHKLHQQNPLGVSENSVGNIVSAYPNPGNGIFQLTSGNAQEEITTLEVYNAAGQKIISCAPGSATYAVDLQTQPAGIYFVQMLIEGKVVQKKLVKE